MCMSVISGLRMAITLGFVWLEHNLHYCASSQAALRQTHHQIQTIHKCVFDSDIFLSESPASVILMLPENGDSDLLYVEYLPFCSIT